MSNSDMAFFTTTHGDMKFVRSDEAVDVSKVLPDTEFYALQRGDMEALVGHPVVLKEGVPNNLTDRDCDLLGAYLAVHTTLARSPLDDKQRLSVLSEVRRFMASDHAAGRRIRPRHALREAERIIAGNLDAHVRQHECLTELSEWLKAPLVLQRPDGSQLARVTEASLAGEVLAPLTRDVRLPEDLRNFGVEHSFVVEHDWRAALGSAVAGDDRGAMVGEVAMPYARCCFEFQVSGKRVCAMMIEADPDDPEGLGLICFPLIRTRSGWALLLMYDVDPMTGRFRPTINISEAVTLADPLADLISANVRAICISLEAEVAQTEVVRIPEKQNRARERRGRLPLLDYHVVSLANRHRLSPVAPELRDGEKRRSPRLHFRRGHWRRYPNHRVKIKWQLVGDPSLGFIDKHYRL